MTTEVVTQTYHKQRDVIIVNQKISVFVTFEMFVMGKLSEDCPAQCSSVWALTV